MNSPAKSRRSKLTQDDTRVKRAELVTFGQPMRDKYRSSGQQREIVATPSSVNSRQPVGRKSAIRYIHGINPHHLSCVGKWKWR